MHDHSVSSDLCPPPLLIATVLDELWIAHAAEVRRVCRARAGADLADEAVSRVALRAHLYFLRDGGALEQPRAWLLAIARNVCSDLRREQERSAVESVDDETLERLSGVQAYAADYGNPERTLLRRERLRETRRAVAALPAHLRAPLLLARDHDSSAIGAALGLSATNVRKRLQVARRRVKRALRRSAED